MKRTTVAALAAFTLAGCAAPAADPAPAPTVTVTQAAPTTEPPAPAPDFIDWMDHQAPEWRDYGTVADMRVLADTICDTLDAGVTMPEVAAIMIVEVGPDVASAALVGAVGLHCDWHEADLDAYVDTL